MGYIFHEIIHFSLGACLAYFIINNDYTLRKKRLIIYVIGGFSGISPDIPKYFGNILAHSILFVPFIGIMIGIIAKFLLRDISLKKLWLTVSISVLSHIFIDYIGDGVAIFYPFVREETDFSIINSVDYFVLYPLLLALIAALFFRRGRLIVTISLSAVILYLSFLSFSKIQFEHALKNKYQDQNIRLLITYPTSKFQWGFQVRTDKNWVNGYSSITKIKINEDMVRKVLN
jgi:membrane-bound metal-dependent hydrolase YbcI (DUF457 family)